MDKFGYSYLIELKTLWEKEKLLIMSSFSFFQNVFKSCLLLMRKNEYLWSKGFTQNLRKASTDASLGTLKEVKSVMLFINLLHAQGLFTPYALGLFTFYAQGLFTPYVQGLFTPYVLGLCTPYVQGLCTPYAKAN